MKGDNEGVDEVAADDVIENFKMFGSDENFVRRLISVCRL